MLWEYCAGYITVDFSGEVFFKGSDNNAYRWTPSSGVLSNITSNGSIAGAITVDGNCGCLAFFRDGNNNLVQLSNPTGHGWVAREIVDHSEIAVTDNLALDDIHNRIYFVGSDNAVYYYSYNLSPGFPNGLTKLEALSTEPANSGLTPYAGNCYYNAGSGLTLSNDKNILYYIGDDSNIWYYFNDHDTYNVNSSGGNWNKTALNYNVPVNGSMIFEPNTNWGGRLYYVDNNSKLDVVTWTTADNRAYCPSCIQQTDGNYILKMDSATPPPFTTAPIAYDSSAITVSIMPNPSENAFNITISNLNNGGNLDLQVFDVSGRPIYQIGQTVPDGISVSQIIWDATTISNGIYFYHLKISGKNFTGKLAKI